MSSSHPVAPSGFLVINKPAGMTSHDVVNRVRRAFGTRQVGHAGTLDPMATGVLVVAIGWATRLLEVVVSDSKGYDAVVELGRITDTDDITGQTLETFPEPFPDQAAVESVLTGFRGDILQTPPIYSAIKQQGQPVYKKARSGEVVELAARPVHIYSLEMTRYSPPLLSLRVECGSGTYIRSLARDIGKELGCGATLAGLHRWRSGNWNDSEACDMETMTDNLLPVETVLRWLPAITVTQDGYTRLLQGLPLPGEREESEALPLVVYEQKIIGMLRYKNGAWWPRKVRPISFQTENTV